MCPWEGGVKRKVLTPRGAPALIRGRARGLQQLGGGFSSWEGAQPQAEPREAHQVSAVTVLPSPGGFQGCVGRSLNAMGTEGHSGPVKEGGVTAPLFSEYSGGAAPLKPHCNMRSAQLCSCGRLWAGAPERLS